MSEPQIVWLRRDLRLCDQEAFTAAAGKGPVIPVYILDDETPGEKRKLGGAARWWLHHSLKALEKDLHRHNSRLILRRGRAVDELCRLAKETGARTVHAVRHYEPWWWEAEKELGGKLDLCLHDGNYLLPPGTVTTNSGTLYKIFTPFNNAMFAAIHGFDILPEPSLQSPENWPRSEKLGDWNLLPTRPEWASGFRDFWPHHGTSAALDRFDEFLEVLSHYNEDREFPSLDGTSKMSPHLHHGEVSPRMLWDRIGHHRNKGARMFRAELIWRDYAQNLVLQFPDYPEGSYRPGYDGNFWRSPERGRLIEEDLHAWQQGRTGYPIVDAGMRQLWQTGWMHNRVRMIAASFLIKHLLIDWSYGERWFWDMLVDADYASNGCNWQWVSGTGVDSNMFVRIMNPLSQSEKFDAAEYIREYVPELADLPDDEIHDPTELCRPADYPQKIVGHKEGRERALAAYRQMKDQQQVSNQHGT